jgi:A/G-specific adenine glycosylase
MNMYPTQYDGKAHIAGRYLLQWFAVQGRSNLPWRVDRDPYRIVVSEFMLQQTQVERVIPLFEAFMARYPSFALLAEASKADVLRLWQGLGYNSRAIRLLALAQKVVAEHGGVLPSGIEALSGLPGIGPYTLAAVRAFAFDLPSIALDTNLRRVLHRVFFGLEHPKLATAAEIEEVALQMLVERESFAWNSAMMDLGANICTARAPKCLICPLRAVCEAAPIDPRELAERARLHAPRRGPQSTMRFEDTTRFLRGRIIERLRALQGKDCISLLDLHANLAPVLGNRDAGEVAEVVEALEREGLIGIDKRGIRLAD